MSAGTIALTNNSTTVTGTGTSFTTELKPGDFVYVTVGGAPYTLVASSVTSDTQLTLAVAFDGPTTTGLAWNAVPASLQVAITQKILNDFAQVARGRILDFQNWQKIYSSDQSVTVTRPDRTTFTGPSWGYMATQFGNKANTTDVLTKADNLNSLTDKATARTNLGLKGAAVLDVGTASGTVAAGNDSRFNTVNGKTGGTVSGTLAATGNLMAQGNSGGIHAAGQFTGTLTGTSLWWNTSNGASTLENNRGGGSGGFLFRCINADNTVELSRFQLNTNGVGFAPGGWQTGSDERIKEDINDIDPKFALQAVLDLRHVTFKMRDKPDGEGGWIQGMRSAGYIAQELEKVLPEAVITSDDEMSPPYECRGDKDELLKIEGVKSIDPGKAGAALNGAAIKALHAIITKQDEIIAELQSRMKAIDGLDA